MPVAEASSPAEFISIEEAAKLIGVVKQTLDNWRSSRRGGPPFVKVSRRVVRYKRTAVLDWMNARTVDPGAKPASKPARRATKSTAKHGRRRIAA